MLQTYETLQTFDRFKLIIDTLNATCWFTFMHQQFDLTNMTNFIATAVTLAIREGARMPFVIALLVMFPFLLIGLSVRSKQWKYLSE